MQIQALKSTGSLWNGSKLNCNLYKSHCKQWYVGYAKYKLYAVTFHHFQIVKLKNVPAQLPKLYTLTLTEQL